MKFKIEDVQIDTFSNVHSDEEFGGVAGDGIRLIHKPTGRTIEFSSKNYIRRGTKERLVAQLKVMVEKYEPEPTKPS